MKKTLFLLLLLVCANSQAKSNTIKGYVTNLGNPLSRVTIGVLGKSVGTISDEYGRYRINASVGDVIRYSYQGLRTVDILVEDVTSILNIDMKPVVTELDEVVVTKNKKKKDSGQLRLEWGMDKNIIRTAYGYMDKNSTGYAMTVIDNKDFNKAAIDFVGAIQGKFPVRMVRDILGEPIFYMRGERVNVLYDVDGLILSKAPLELPLNNIDRMAILRSRVALSIYPQIMNSSEGYGLKGGAAGMSSYNPIGAVIVINTKSANNINEEGKPYDYARLRTNYSDGKELNKVEVDKNAPVYLRELRKATSISEAKNMYSKYIGMYKSSPYFALDAYKYFWEQWHDAAFADNIIDKHYYLFEDNAVLLKALAYHYESQGRYKMANKVFKDVYILRPQYAQSYLDLANSSRNIGKNKRAAILYARYFYLLDEGFLQADAGTFSPIINREFNNLLALGKGHMSEVVSSRRIKVKKDEYYRGKRVVFEWNDSEAEFDLQFVNPMNQYDTWQHSLEVNADIIYKEKNFGYTCSEFLIEDSIVGTWKINAKYLGNKSLTPTYLKATVYYDYGEKSQYKETYVFKLSIKNVNRELFTVAKSP